MRPPHRTHAGLVDKAASRIDTGGRASDPRKTVHVTTKDAIVLLFTPSILMKQHTADAS